MYQSPEEEKTRNYVGGEVGDWIRRRWAEKEKDCNCEEGRSFSSCLFRD